jgi:hypothetical protein
LATIKRCEARRLFEQDTSYDYRQGLGWYWIIQADLALAGITRAKPAEVMAFADSALNLLLPIKNWSVLQGRMLHELKPIKPWAMPRPLPPAQPSR